MALLDDEIKKEVKKVLDDLENPVRLVMFTQEFECNFCRETRQLVTEVGELSEKIKVEILNFVTDKDKADEYAVDKIPAIVVLGEKDYGIRLYGIPSGYEFSSLIDSILLVSSGVPDLSEEGLLFAQSIQAPVHIQVYVTPTCPYCPRAVVLGFNFAMANDLVTADMVEATEFPYLAQKYQVMGVPRSVINEEFHIEGAAPEPLVIEKIREALSKDGEE